MAAKGHRRVYAEVDNNPLSYFTVSDVEFTNARLYFLYSVFLYLQKSSQSKSNSETESKSNSETESKSNSETEANLQQKV